MIRIEPGALPAFVNAANPSVRAERAPRTGTENTPVNKTGESVTAKTGGTTSLGQLQMINDSMNTAAVQQRSGHQVLEKIGAVLGQMKETAIKIIKNYPPYPPGDMERIRFLRSFNGLRQQIDSLTIPPNDQWLGREPGGPEAVRAPGLGIAPLPDDASHGQMLDAVAQTVRAAEQVADGTARLSEAAAAGQDRMFVDKVAVLRQGQQDLQVPELPHDAVEGAVAGIRSGLGAAPATGITGADQSILQVVG